MSASNFFETALLGLIFNAVDITGITTSPNTDLFVSLHTGDPGEGGDQGTNEADYGNYSRVAVSRDTNGFLVSGDSAVNVSEIVFPSCTGGSNVLTHFGIGLAASGATTLLISAPLTATLAVSNGITPIFQVGEMVSTVD